MARREGIIITISQRVGAGLSAIRFQQQPAVGWQRSVDEWH